MASPSTPTHGLWANIFYLRPNGFKGSGLNDVTWGSFSSGLDSAHFEVVIDGVGTGGGGVDTFKWRENGGAWTVTVDITGASQNLVGANGTQAITFAATTGHTIGDQWSIGNLYAEPTTESGTTAQITDADLRLLNPNHPPTWTDDGGKTVLEIDYTRGWANFTDTVGNVTVTGNNGYILESGLDQLGYLKGWDLNINCPMVNADRCQNPWGESLPGIVTASGIIEKMVITNKDLWDEIIDCADGTQQHFLIQLFSYDPDDDQTGDHWNLWVTFNSKTFSAQKTDVVKSNVNFTVQGQMGGSFTAQD